MGKSGIDQFLVRDQTADSLEVFAYSTECTRARRESFLGWCVSPFAGVLPIHSAQRVVKAMCLSFPMETQFASVVWLKNDAKRNFVSVQLRT